MQKILVTGGAGFIGSHTCYALRKAGFEPVIYDDFSNGHKAGLEAFDIIEGSTHDQGLLIDTLSRGAFQAVVHFAAFIEAGESVIDPEKFYRNNVGGTLTLLQAMRKTNVRDIVFSSTAAVYGEPPSQAPLTEGLPKHPINPYGHSKLQAEQMLEDFAKAYGIRAVALRYFNAAGSHPNGLIGEQHDPETHLIPLVLQAADGRRDCIKIFGDDYPTDDGTCIRDYIHVCDLADAHVKALGHIRKQPQGAFFDAFNLGNGEGYSVREVIEAAKTVTGVDFEVRQEDRRPGDPSVLVADAARARTVLGWTPSFPTLEDMIGHAWNFLRPQKQR